MSDAELKAWQAEWTAQPVSSGVDLAVHRRNAVRQQVWLRVQHISELVAAALFLLLAAAVVWNRPTLEALAWACVVCATTVAAVGFSAWNWRLLWTADVKSVADFTAAYRQRCRATLRAATFGQRFLYFQLAVAVPWLTVDYTRHELGPRASLGSVVVLLVCTIGFSWLFRRHRRSAARELRELEDDPDPWSG